MRKRDTDIPTEFGDRADDRRGGRRWNREIGEEPGRHRNNKGGEGEGGSQKGETTHSAEERVAKKHARTERSDTEMDTEGGGETGTCQSQSRHKKGHMKNIYLTDSDEEAIVDFVKDHEEIYNKTSTSGQGPDGMPVAEVLPSPNPKGFAVANSPSSGLARLPRK